jgi:tetratricopeptide (TPR) repeat protein
LEVQQTWESYLHRAFWHFANAGEAPLALQTASPITRFLDRWGEWDELLRLCQKSLQLAKESGDEKAVAKWTHWLAMCLHDRGDYGEAERLYRESLEISERLGNLEGKAVTLHELGRLRWKQGRKAKAEELLKQALDIFERIGHRRAKEVRKDLERLQSESA